MRKMVNELMRRLCVIWRDSKALRLYTHTHTHGNLIERIRVVDDYSICDGRNRLLLNRLRARLSKGLFCVCNRRVYASLWWFSLDGIGMEVR